MKAVVSTCAILFLGISTYGLTQNTGVCNPSAGPRAMIRLSGERDRINQEKVRNYTWMQRSEKRKLDSSGVVKSTEVRVSEFMQIYGEPYQRLISVDGKPVSEKEKAKQEEKIDKLIRERENESPEQRQKRLAEYDKRKAEERAFVEEIADAYNFELLPSEKIQGHTAYVLDAQPKPGYRPRHKRAEILPKFRFRAWLNAEDCNWIKVDAQAIDTVSYGAILARIGKGTRVLIEQTEVNDEVWLLRHLLVKVDGRIMLLKKLNQEIDVTFSEYRKFSSESRITGFEELTPDNTDPH